MPPQVAGGKLFISSAAAGGPGSDILYALDAGTGATVWGFQTVVDQTAQQLGIPAGGAWDAVPVGPDHSIYAGIGNPYLSLQQAEAAPSRELHTDSLVKLNQDTGALTWYYQAFPNDFHDWDLQASPMYTTAKGRPVVLAAGKAGVVFAFTTTFSGEVVALSRGDGSVVWTTQLPAGSNAPLAIVGNMLLAGAGFPLDKAQHPVMVAYALGAKGVITSPTAPPGMTQVLRP